MASKWLWCIFQLPLMSGFRAVLAASGMGVARRAEGLEAGQVAELEELAAGAAAGRHVVDVRGELARCQRAGAVAAADDGEGRRLGARLGDGPGAGLEP